MSSESESQSEEARMSHDFRAELGLKPACACRLNARMVNLVLLVSTKCIRGLLV